jgi:hypothetical protein
MKTANPLANPCPGCGGPSQVRSSRPVTSTFRTVYLVCRDMMCGCSFAGALEITHVISPSSVETPKVALPYRPALRGQPGKVPVEVGAAILAATANDGQNTSAASSGG